MKPAPFQYLQPATLDEALAMLHRYQPAARILAGGQSLVPLMNFRQTRPEFLIDINHLEDLAYIRETGGMRMEGGVVHIHDSR